MRNFSLRNFSQRLNLAVGVKKDRQLHPATCPRDYSPRDYSKFSIFIKYRTQPLDVY